MTDSRYEIKFSTYSTGYIPRKVHLCCTQCHVAVLSLRDKETLDLNELDRASAKHKCKQLFGVETNTTSDSWTPSDGWTP